MMIKPILLLLVVTIIVAESAPNINLLQVLCNQNIFVPGTPFARNLDYVFNDILQHTPISTNHIYRNISPEPTAFVFGNSSCSPTLSAVDCSSCLNTIVGSLFPQNCGNVVGARIQLVDCSIRYEAYAFSATD